MKIVLDVFLLMCKQYFEKIEEPGVVKSIEKIMDNKDVQVSKKYSKDFDLQKAMNEYIKNNDKLKNHLTKISEALIAQQDSDSSEEAQDVTITKQRKKSFKDDKANNKTSKRKNSEVSNTTNGTLNKKRKPSISKDYKETKDKKKAKKEEESDSDMDFIDPKKMKEKLGIKDSEVVRVNKPFSRVDHDKYAEYTPGLKNNSWEDYAKRSGNDFANKANERLRVTAGKGFKKEKTKFKNKTEFGGGLITQEVKSIALCSDSD